MSNQIAMPEYKMTFAEARALLGKINERPDFRRSSNLVRNYVRDIVWAEQEPQPVEGTSDDVRRSLEAIEKARAIVRKARA